MFASVNQADRFAVSRLLEFLSPNTPWQRSLWGVGVVLAMDELYEGCSAHRQGHLSEGSIRRVMSALQKRVGLHPSFTASEKAFLRQQLQQVPRAESPAHFAIRDLAARISRDYLTRWGAVVASSPTQAELFARSVAAHLLDAGFSSEYLHAFVKELLGEPRPITLKDVCDALQAEVIARPISTFEVLLALDAVPETAHGVPSNWLQGPQVTSWLSDHGFNTAAVRSPVAIVLPVQARDAIGAAQAARNEADRYAARSLIATGKPLRLADRLWVKGHPEPFGFDKGSRGVSVKELFREDRVFTTDANQSVDAALELLAHLEDSSPPAAIAGGWAAIEGLLADPSDRAGAASNLASLVTCSFPRAELTLLSYRAEQENSAARARLAGDLTNRERSRTIASMITDGTMPTMRRLVDSAAVARMEKLLKNPNGELQTIRNAISESFHRLYMQRNLILHGGKLDSVALSASLRTVAKLAGAGMDRITHGHYVQSLSPLELVAKAELALAMISKDKPLDCVDLLETI